MAGNATSEVKTTLRELAGTEGADLAGLVKAITETATEEAFDLITGSNPVPSNMADARALRLRRLCRHAGRPLRAREIEIVFRVSSSTAKSIDTRMRATYPRELQTLRKEMLAAMRKGATALWVKVDDKDHFKVKFDSRASRELAEELLATALLTKDLQRDGDQTIVFPAKMTGPDDKAVNALTGVLGLTEP